MITNIYQQSRTMRKLHIIYPPTRTLRYPIPTLLPSLEMLADSYCQSINSFRVPKNITYFYSDDNLKSARGAGFQVSSVDERLWVADMMLGKTLRDRHVKYSSLVR